MKQIIIIFLICIISFAFVLGYFHTTEAGSGVCYQHSDVNCDIGPDWDGSVICNDGWADSPTSYYEHCGSFSGCEFPYHVGCKNEGDLAVLRATIEDGALKYTPDMAARLLDTCTNEISEYQRKQRTYNQCINNQKTQQQIRLQSEINLTIERASSETSNTCIKNYGFGSYFDEAAGTCSCKRGFQFYNGRCIENEAACVLKHGPQSVPIKVVGDTYTCSCVDGYILLDNQCISFEQFCKETLGPDSYPKISRTGDYDSFDAANCECKEDYVLTLGKCAKKETRRISTRAKMFIDTEAGPCIASRLPEKEIEECITYDLQKNKNIFNWEVYDPSKPIPATESLKPASQPLAPKALTPQKIKTPDTSKEVLDKKQDLKIQERDDQSQTEIVDKQFDVTVMKKVVNAMRGFFKKLKFW